MSMAGERADARRRARRARWVAVLPLLLTACAGGPAARTGDAPGPPVIPIPDRYSESGPAQAAGAPGAGAGAQAPTATTPAGAEWWRALGSPELDGLVDRGMANNADMRVATQHIVQAKARFDQARAGRLPVVTAPLLAGDQSAGSGSVGAAPTGTAGSSGGGSSGSQKTWQASIRADWQIDLWGEQSALARSARFQLQRALHERENVARELAGAIAGSYIDYLAVNDRRRIARSTEEVQSATLTVIEGRVKAGDATMADLEQQRAAIFSVRASLPVLEQQRLDALANLAQLVGTVPGRLTLTEQGLDSLRTPAELTGLPSQLLLRRPDIRMAEAQLHAAHADVAVARARLLPPMDLVAQLGRSAASPAQLLLPQTLFWNVVDSLTVSLFDGGRRQGEEAFSRAVEEEMVESYVRAIRGGVREVESALATLRLTGERLTAEQQTLEAARRAMEISSRIYKVGGVDYLTLLDTQRTYHRYLDDYQQVRASQFRAHVALLQALGGDLRPAPPADGGAATAPAAGAHDHAGDGADAMVQHCLAGLPGDDGRPAGSGDWQVELAGTYHCATVAPAWHDLARRYPDSMGARVLRPTLAGRVQDLDDGEQSWYRLAVSRFATREQAQAFCAKLQSDQQRCEVSATPLARPLGSRAGTTSATARSTGAGATGAAGETGPMVAGTLADAALSRSTGSVPGLEITSLLAASDQASQTAAPEDGGTAPAGPRPAAAPAGISPALPAPSAAGATRTPAGRFLQLGAFRDAARAESLRARAAESLRDLPAAVSLRREGELHLVWAGPFTETRDEHVAAARLRDLTGESPRSVRGSPSAGGP